MEETEERMKFPVRINPATGRFEMVSGKEMIRQSVMLILKTEKGERWLNSQLGSNIKAYAFMEMNRTELNIMEREIRSCLLNQEPELENIRVNSTCDFNKGILEVTIAYSIRDEEDSVTVPLYMEDKNERDF